MALIRWEPARELRTSRSDFDRLFASVFDTSTFAAPSRRPAPARFAPALDIVEADGEFVIKADLPGLSEQDITLQVTDNVLSISGERKDERQENREGYVRIERSSGHFSRSLALPKGTDAAAVTAAFTNGVLEIHVPKPVEAQPHTVEISLGAASEN